MVGDARLLILFPLETRQVAPDNPVVLTLKLGNQTLVAPYSTDNRSIKFENEPLNEINASYSLYIPIDLTFNSC